jgi:hypothetical protein
VWWQVEKAAAEAEEEAASAAEEEEGEEEELVVAAGTGREASVAAEAPALPMHKEEREAGTTARMSSTREVARASPGREGGAQPAEERVAGTITRGTSTRGITRTRGGATARAAEEALGMGLAARVRVRPSSEASRGMQAADEPGGRQACPSTPRPMMAATMGQMKRKATAAETTRVGPRTRVGLAARRQSAEASTICTAAAVGMTSARPGMARDGAASAAGTRSR